MNTERFNREFNQRAERSDHASAVSKLAAAWGRAESRLPSWLRALLSGVAAVAPILLLISSIQSVKTADDSIYAAGRNALPGLYTLLLLALAAVAQPLLFQLYYTASGALGVWDILSESRADNAPSPLGPYAPMALGIALMLVPFLRSVQEPHTKKRTLLLPILSMACASVGITILLVILLLQMSAWNDPTFDETIFNKHLGGVTLPPDAVLPLTLASIGVGIAVAWVPLFWAFRALVPGRGFFGASLVAGASAVLLTLAGYLVEAARVLLEPAKRDYAYGEPSWQSPAGSALLPLLLFYILLRAFREIVAAVVPHGWKARVLRYGSNLSLFVCAALVTLPRLSLDRATPADMGVIEVLGIFQSFGLVIAAITAVAVLTSRAPDSSAENNARIFEFQPAEVTLLSALYAGYLSLWTSEALATATAIIVGWVVFRYLVIDSAKRLPTRLASAEVAQQLVQLRQDSALLTARQRAVDDRFSKGEDNYSTLTAARDELNGVRTQLQSRLGVDLKEAKRRLLEFGPGRSPLVNGVRGAAAGFVFATGLLLVSSIRGPELEGPLRSWVDLARSALADPAYAVARATPAGLDFNSAGVSASPSPDLLLFVGALINAYFFWLVLGFLFGFVFHRIRGDDGVIKALVFAAGVAVTYGISQLLSVSADGIHLLRVVPAAVFLLITGVAVFDARSLATRGLSPAKLPDVYGFRTSLGYASVIGAVVSLQPVLTFVLGLFGK